MPMQVVPSPPRSAVDWTSMPLPQLWERRLDAGSGRAYYVNHAQRSTQWFHPDDPRGARARARLSATVGPPRSSQSAGPSPAKKSAAMMSASSIL